MKKQCIKSCFSSVRIGYRLLVVALLGLVLGGGWWAGETAARQLDAEMREQMLLKADDIIRDINPLLIRSLTFTAADKGTPAFEYMRTWIMNVDKTSVLHGVYSIAVQGDHIVCGLENYFESNSSASPPGTIYEEPPSVFWHVLQSGTPVVIGPYTDEFGTFVSALMPVHDPVSGRVLMAVGIDIIASDWQASLRASRFAPLLKVIFVLLLLAGGTVFTFPLLLQITV